VGGVPKMGEVPKVFGGLWNVKFVDFTKLLKKEKYFPLVIFDKRKNRSNLTYLRILD